MLSDRERRELEAIERGLLDSDPTCSQRFGSAHAEDSSTVADPIAAGYAELALISGVFAVLLLSRWPVLSALLLVTTVLNWRVGRGGRRLFGRRT